MLAGLKRMSPAWGMEIRLSEVMSAMSYALDITEGQPEGHAARSCVIGMRIARELELSSDHERIDGNGYHRGIAGGALSTAMKLMDKNAGAGVCPEVLAALKCYLVKGSFSPVKLAA